MTELVIRGPSGLGDGIYLYPILKHLIKKGNKIKVKTKYPELYSNLKCECIPWLDKAHVDINCTYLDRKAVKATSQFEDMCITAGIKEKIDLKINIGRFVTFKTKKICVIQKPYFPMNEAMKRYDLMPNYEIIQRLINDFRDDFHFVQVGKTGSFEDDLYKIRNIDKDEVNKTCTGEVLRIIAGSDMFISQIGWGIAAAEALNKKIFVIFSAKGLKSQTEFFRTITPEKVITKPTSYYCVDDENYDKIKERFKDDIDKR